MNPESSPLVLEILKQDSALKMSIFKQADLALTLRHYSQCNVSFDEIYGLCQEITSILQKSLTCQDPYAPDLVRGLQRCGLLLWEHLLTKAVKDALRHAQAKELILSIDEELINIPWELLYDGSSFLCLNFNLGRLVRTKQELNAPQYRSLASVLKMLILANPTGDLKSSYLEGVFIKNQFDKRRNQISINFKSTNIDTLYVKKSLHDYDILHFAGHCEYDSKNPANSGWIFCDGKFNAGDILTMGQTATLPALVFSNACHSAKAEENNYTLASAFLFSGVSHYIGAIRRIEDPVSLSFAKEFYTQIFQGKSIGEGIRLSRLQLVKEYGIMSLHWASYLLYGDPNFVLFRVNPAPIKLRGRLPLSVRRSIQVSLTAVIISVCVYLYTWLPTLNPNAYFLFLRSQKLYSQGRNQEVILQASRVLKKDPAFLEVYPLLAATYQRIGNREAALKYLFDYARYSEQKHDRNNLASAYIAIGWFYQAEGEFSKAFDFYNKAISLAKESGDKLNEALALRKLAVWYMDKDDYTRALELLTRSQEMNRQRQYIYAHKYNLACDYFDIGLVFANKDDYSSAKEFYKKSQALFESLKLKNETSDYYFNMGEICLYEKEYQKALDYYLRGIKIDEEQGNKMNLASDFNMAGELYAEMDDPNRAQEYFLRGIAISRELNLQPELAGAYHNLGLLYKKLGKKNKTRESLRQAQEIYRKIDPSSYEEIKKELLSLDDN